jgi:hypothetical protein
MRGNDTGSSMRYLTQQSLLWLVLAAHLVAFEWGPSLHRWQCSTTGSTNFSSDCSGCCGPQHVEDSAEVALADPQSGEPSSAPVPHDPRHCSICKFFAYSPAATLEMALLVKIEAGQELPVRQSPLIVQASSSSHLARGPPLWS